MEDGLQCDVEVLLGTRPIKKMDKRTNFQMRLSNVTNWKLIVASSFLSFCVNEKVPIVISP